MRCWIGAPTVLLFASALSGQHVLTANYDNDRTNANLQERILSASNVTPETFGKLGTFTVNGQVYAQPLYVEGAIIDGAARNVIYAATMHNTVYAFDADAVGSNPLWSATLGPSVPSSGLNAAYLGPEIGILSTPVIDLVRNAIYVVAFTLEQDRPIFRLHALDLLDGTEKLGGPVEINAVVEGAGDATKDGNIAFDASQHLQRAGLLLANDKVYIAFGSQADQFPYHGWVMSYDASFVARQTAVFNVTPQGGSGAIWQSGRGLAADDLGNIYFASANGDYDGERNFGQSFVKLSPDLSVVDWFTPIDWNWLSDYDYDLGSLGPVLLRGTNQLIGGDKFGSMYLVDLQNMGRFGLDGTFPQIFKPVRGGGIFTIAYWESMCGAFAYVVEAGTATRAYRISGGQFDTTPVSEGAVADDFAYQGIAISANGGEPGSGILWLTTGDHHLRGLAPGTIHALDALDLTHELWNSEMIFERDRLGAFAKFVAPTIANGRVYVPTFSNQLAVYGLIPQ
jgi:hypothetical protein